MKVETSAKGQALHKQPHGRTTGFTVHYCLELISYLDGYRSTSREKRDMGYTWCAFRLRALDFQWAKMEAGFFSIGANSN